MRYVGPHSVCMYHSGKQPLRVSVTVSMNSRKPLESKQSKKKFLFSKDKYETILKTFCSLFSFIPFISLILSMPFLISYSLLSFVLHFCLFVPSFSSFLYFFIISLLFHLFLLLFARILILQFSFSLSSMLLLHSYIFFIFVFVLSPPFV